MMQALLVWAVGLIKNKDYLKGAFVFSVLLNFKHIYLYCAPAFFIYLLKEYVFGKEQIKLQSLKHTSNKNLTNDSFADKKQQSWFIKLTKVGIITIIPFVLSFGPFLIVGGIDQLKQIFSRLFPFSRGLVHEYWAPNFWAIYYFMDKLLFILGIRNKVLYQIPSGNVQTSLRVLPEVPATLTLILIVVGLLPLLLKYIKMKNKVDFTMLVCLSGLVFFLFGFHVHEKAIAPYIALLFVFQGNKKQVTTATFVNIVNLVPLLILPGEKIFALVCCLLWICICDQLQKQNKTKTQEKLEDLINRRNIPTFSDIMSLISGVWTQMIRLSGIAIVIFHLFVHPLLKKPSLEFLPLMMNSVWAALFNISWTGYLYMKFMKEQI